MERRLLSSREMSLRTFRNILFFLAAFAAVTLASASVDSIEPAGLPGVRSTGE